MTDMFRGKTGLVIDPVLLGTKLRWILENVEERVRIAAHGDLLFGTIDTWLMYKLSKGRIHVTDYSNASRTMMFNINTLEWDEDILNILDMPASMLPEVRPSSCLYGESDPEFFGGAIPIAGAAGDQQAALFGQTCFEEGDAKNTYGTGCFMLAEHRRKPVFSDDGLLTTIAWGLDGKINYALEGSVCYVAGAAIQWLRDELEAHRRLARQRVLRDQSQGHRGLLCSACLHGLGAPHWDPYARGAIMGIWPRGVNKYHLIRATLESLAFQTNDVLHAMELDSGVKLGSLRSTAARA